MSISTITESIVADLTAKYANAQATNRIPSLLEMVALCVQLVDLQSLTGAQKMEIVKSAVAGVVNQLPINPEDKAKLQAALFTVDNLAEAALSLIKANEMLSGQVEGCCRSWCGIAAKPTPEVKPLNIPFPLLK